MMPQSKMMQIKADVSEMKGRNAELNADLKAAKNLLLCLGIYDRGKLKKATVGRKLLEEIL